MNRRSFFSSMTACLVGLGFFLRKSQGINNPVLEGLTDTDMAELIARFPQGPYSLMLYFRRLEILEENRYGLVYHSTWKIKGTIIYTTMYSEAYGEQTRIIDVRSINFIRMRMGCRVDKRQPMREYKRVSGNWFTLSDSELSKSIR